MKYYELNGIMVRDSIEEDVETLKDRLRRADIDEIWASHRRLPEEALKTGLQESVICLTIVSHGIAVGMFGIRPETLMGDSATIWFLASDGVEDIKIRFVRNCKTFINLFLDKYPRLWNMVHVKNKKSVEWLTFLGAAFSDTVVINGEEFIRFSFEVKK